ncbi:VOC family protein [Bacillus sp. NTK071]|uniref:VOC family protein n=1 Tax=Bacillus sp. NTK071 TaxID=2802175 RepID=UPI001A8E6A4C|nr:VOC family protein [Bacillus sp. NTK071]
MLNQVCVLTVKVKEMKESLSFYTEMFNFTVSKKYSDKIVSLVHKNIPIVLEEDPSINLSESKNVLLGISSENIDYDFKLLKERGANVLFDEPKPCPPGLYFIVEDPSGNQIEVVEFTNEDQ